jgi:TolB-like protein/Tfp pilus assembly protein PilF
LNHPSIATVHDFDRQGELDFLVMELIQGTPLSDALADGPLSPSQVIGLGTQLAKGLAAAHEQGIVHRDVKPSNLFIVSDGRLKILDFGLARMTEDATGSITAESLTDSNRILGTLPYMPPEQIRGEQADFRSDIYSAGAVLYEIATGRRVIPDTGAHAVIEHVINGTPERPGALNPDVPSDLERVILKCLAKSPGRRFQSAKELEAALRRMDERRSTAASRDAPFLGSRRRKTAVAVIAAAVGLLAVFAPDIKHLWQEFLRPPPALEPIRSIVVLPLENLSEPEQQYFADGMTDLLIMDLAQIRSLRVISRTSAMHYQGTRKLLPEIAEELGVDGVVGGAVLRSGEKVRITLQLVDAREERTIWAAKYEHDLVDILKLQGDVAKTVAHQVRAVLTPGEQNRLGRAVPVNPRAYEAYLKGRHFMGRRTPDGLASGIEHFELAAREDPAFASAHAELANCFLLLGSIGFDVMRPTEAVKLARAAAQAALEIDEDSAEAQTAMAHIRHNIDWNWGEAEEGFRKAIELNPGYATAHQWYGFYLATRGRLDEAIAAQSVALEIDPLSPLIHASLGRLFYYKRDHDEAARYFRRALELDPMSLPALLVYGMVHLQEGRFTQALATFEKGRAVSRESPAFIAGIGGCYGASGDSAGALAIVEQLADLATQRYVPAFYTAAVYAGLEDRERALDWLEKAYEERSEAVLYLGVEPLVDNLRSEPRFQRIRAQVGGGVG